MTAPHDERGAAVVDFTLVSLLVLALFLAVFQLGIGLFLRNTLISCAAEGARAGARLSAGPTDGVDRARSLITSSISASYAEQVSSRVETVGGVQVVVVEVVAPLPVFGPFGPPGALTVHGRSFLESQ